jgi:hypothetical protein
MVFFGLTNVGIAAKPSAQNAPQGREIKHE